MTTKMIFLVSVVANIAGSTEVYDVPTPLVIATWPNMVPAVEKAWSILENNGTTLDALEMGINVCEMALCGNNVGFATRPDETGETTQDAMIMDGETHKAAAVGGLRRIKRAISVARKVMEHTKHTLLVGDRATEFAVKMGFTEESLVTSNTTQEHGDWKANSCQPNFWVNVLPDPTTSCGPYSIPPGEVDTNQPETPEVEITPENHDTIGMISIDINGHIGVGVSTNGLRHKIAGRVGDSPIPGSGGYVDKAIGAACATGNGDILMRFCPSFLAVENMRNGMSPEAAAIATIERISAVYPEFTGALIVVNKLGDYGTACYGLKKPFEYTIRNPMTGDVQVLSNPCLI